MIDMKRRDITPGDFGLYGVGPGSCGLYAAIGNVDLMASIKSAMELQERGTNGAGIFIRGIYPDMKEFYAFHVMYLNRDVANELEQLITGHRLGVRHIGEMESLVKPAIYRQYALPELRRYFVTPPTSDEMMRRHYTTDPDIYMRRIVEKFNLRNIGKARIFSSGKNVGTFHTAYNLETTVKTYGLEKYADMNVTAVLTHMRWPTSIVNEGVWYGIHPIGFINSHIIHNGDLSSSPSNKQGVSAAGVQPMVGTDSEAMLLELDNLLIDKDLDYQQIEWAMCQMYPQEEAKLSPETFKEYESLLRDRPEIARFKMSGPSSFVSIIRKNGIARVISGRDRDGLRQLWMGRSDDGKSVIWSSEEKCIYQTAFLSGKNYKSINCEPGRITAFELDDHGNLDGVFGETLQ
jgi:glutamate synthase domain-containing protein 1